MSDASDIPDPEAAIVYNRREIEDGDFTDDMIALLVKFFQDAGPHDLVADGMCGPKTQAVLSMWIMKPGVAESTPWRGPARIYPATYGDRKEVFGGPGNQQSAWYRDSIVETHGADRMPGMPGWQYVKVHRMVEPYAREGFRRAAEASSYKVTRCGSWNLRSVQFAGAEWSSHAYGIAFDINPRDNRAKRFVSADDVPEPWSDAWREIWPNGVDNAFVTAMQSVGFRWGGDYRTFVDPMHFEWVGNLGWANEVHIPLAA